MNAQRPKFTIHANGGDGESGYTEYSWRDPQAPKYQDGLDGRSALTPGDGGSAGFLTLLLSPSRNQAGGIHVEGIGVGQPDHWEVPPGQDLFLGAQGGHGGDGGVGEDGQQGGRGRDGEDATLYRTAGLGHTGKVGGRGGYGSNGANGGNGGTIEVTVREEDMNLLSAVSWNVSGGNGGAAGAHGRPGRGGPGGRGGASYSWTEEIAVIRMVENSAGRLEPHTYYETDYHTHPEGWSGSSGRQGMPHLSSLYDGALGQNGTFSFFILRRNGEREQYHGCYNLQASVFEMIDENEDGVYEPGEHVLIKNIQVHNTGVMPSPSLTNIPLSIHSSPWLNTGFPQGGVLLPTSIPPGGVYQARGYMKAFIKQEPTLRLQPGQPLTANDAVNVTAVMPGINRPLDNFVIRSPLTVRYPLELLPPAYLRTVSIGDEFTIQWTIRNISRKPYGLNSNPSRLCGTRLRQAGSFEFKPPVENDESFQYAQLIEPGGETTFYQVFCVSDSAEPFSRGSMHLEMLLGEPGSDASLFSPSPSPISSVRLIARFDLNIQMSPAYKYDPEASFLLLVNTDTPGSLIREITGYIRAMLHLKVDVYNLSVSGTLVDKRTDENILTRYAGRTIIILCNSTDYFGQPGRVAYEFIDPWLVSRLLKAKTSILFLGLTNVSHVTDYWGRMVATPELPIDPSGADGSMHVQGIDVLLAGFQNSMKLTNEPGLELTRHTVSIKKPVFQSFKTSSSRSGKKLAKRLSKRYPFRSYTLTADCTNASKTNPAKLIVREGVSSDIAILASSTSCKQEFSHLPASFEYLIAAALPFEKRLQMLWTGSTNPEYLGSGAKHDEAADKQDSAKSVSAVQLPEKVHRHIALSIQYNALREVASFCFKAPLRDPSSKLDINILLPLLSKFFSTARASLIGFNKIPDNTKQWLISTMGWLEAETGPKLFGGAWSRKRLVKDFIKINITNAPFQGLEAELKQRRPQFKKSIKDLRKNIKKRKDTQESLVLTATKTEIAQAVGVTDTLFHDIGQQITKSSPTSFWSEDNHAKALNTHLVFAQRIDADEARSKHMLQAMIVSNTAQNQGGGVAEINKGQ